MPYPSLPGHRSPDEIQPPAALRPPTQRPKPQPKSPPKPSQQPKPSSTNSSSTANQSSKAGKPSHSARIHSWDHSKGYGFLRHGKKNLFLHRRDFAEHHKKPMPGDLIHFEEGKDAKGRPCAVQAYHHNDGGSLRGTHFVQLALLIILPTFALFKLATATSVHFAIPHAIPYAIALVLSLITYQRYAKDKQSARAKAWRISESQLHVLSLIGGWPGAFLAQRKLRHKCSKTDFISFFWLTILIHQYLALDYLCQWQITRSILTKITEVT